MVQAQKFRLAHGTPSITDRNPDYITTDISAVHAIAQAAVNVELFTIPLYMSAMYSIQGMHEINTANTDFYLGRRWPGAGPSAAPKTVNERAFNVMFSVFIEEMLHLQMAANLMTIMRAVPSFNRPSLQTANHGWICYGPERTTIPQILDLRDTIAPYNQLKVDLQALSVTQLDLFRAIEQREEDAMGIIQPDKRSKYFPVAPFDNWVDGDEDESHLPMFGSIGHMYKCLRTYLNLHYSDGTSLWSYLWDAQSVQHDLFNSTPPEHPKSEYPGFAARFSDQSSDPAFAHLEAMAMINAITDQGEGSLVTHRSHPPEAVDSLKSVEKRYSPDPGALEADYPRYNAKGDQVAPSSHMVARWQPSGDGPGQEKDHFERFTDLQSLIQQSAQSADHLETWDQWAKDHPNGWTAKDLETGEGKPSDKIPSSQEVADALNRVSKDYAGYGGVLSQVCAGAIAGVTTVLDSYWNSKNTGFPGPSMAGSGDRMSIYWVLFGRAPDLSLGVPPRSEGRLYHACQGMNLDPSYDKCSPSPSKCAPVECFHTCRGSNSCHAEGGCGYVQGGSCSPSPTVRRRGLKAPANIGTTLNAPSDNKCAGFGGCAVPISASQLYPDVNGGVMQLYRFDQQQGDWHAEEIPGGVIKYAYGDSVYETAWQAYITAATAMGQTPRAKPTVDDIRLVFPPST